MDPISTGFTQQTTIAGFLAFTVVGLVTVAIFLWKEIKAERTRCSESQAEIQKIASDMLRVTADLNRTQEERNRQMGELSGANSKLGVAIDHLSQILELQHDRVLELLREIKAQRP
jgi:hypothetical protein